MCPQPSSGFLLCVQVRQLLRPLAVPRRAVVTTPYDAADLLLLTLDTLSEEVDSYAVLCRTMSSYSTSRSDVVAISLCIPPSLVIFSWATSAVFMWRRCGRRRNLSGSFVLPLTSRIQQRCVQGECSCTLVEVVWQVKLCAIFRFRCRG